MAETMTKAGLALQEFAPKVAGSSAICCQSDTLLALLCTLRVGIRLRWTSARLVQRSRAKRSRNRGPRLLLALQEFAPSSLICPAEQAGQINEFLEAKVPLWEQIPEEPYFSQTDLATLDVPPWVGLVMADVYRDRNWTHFTAPTWSPADVIAEEKVRN